MAAKVQGTWRAYEPAGIQTDLSVIDTTARHPLGTRCKAKDVGSTGYGLGEFIYLGGTDSVTCAAGSVVYIKDDYTVALVAARAVGACALALSAITSAAMYGWFQVLGKGVAASDTVSANTALYVDGTAGRVDDAAVAGDQVIGARANTASDTNTIVVTLGTYPAIADFDNA
jgi:hypothetical protein